MMKMLPKNNQEKNKEKVEIISYKLSDEIVKLKLQLAELEAHYLFIDSNKTSVEWYRKQSLIMREYKADVMTIISKSQKAIIKGLKTDTKGIEITSKAFNKEKDVVNNVIKSIGEQTIESHNKDIIQIKSTKGPELQKIIIDRLSKKAPQFVEIDNGAKWKVENYVEMKVRTDLSHEVNDNMLDTAKKYGVVFMICSYFGDCAKDHADYQGKVYYVKGWENGLSDNQIQEIEAYIKSNDIKCVDDVMNDSPYLTTRPNCRHYFQYIAVEDVLGKTSKELNEYREKNGMNWNGKYKEEKYQATQEQRYNERQIRSSKEQIINSEAALKSGLSKEAKDDEQAKLIKAKETLNYYRAKQRKLINTTNNKYNDYEMERDPTREKIGNPSNMRLKV